MGKLNVTPAVMKKAILIFTLGILVHPALSQNIERGTLMDSFKANELPGPKNAIHGSGAFNYTPPWLRHKMAQDLSLNPPDILWEMEQLHYPVNSSHFGILNSKIRF